MLHYLDDNGKVVFQKKLDIEPMAIHLYNIEDKNYVNNKLINIMYMISSHQDHILVYKGTNLSWALKVNDTPVYLNTCDFYNCKGLIVSLSDTGRLSVLYLGMEPVKNQKIMMLNKNLDLDYIASENERLTQIVNNYNKGIVVSPKTSITVTVSVDQNIIYDDDYEDAQYFSDHKGRVIRVII
jgi:hypothetical protein